MDIKRRPRYQEIILLICRSDDFSGYKAEYADGTEWCGDGDRSVSGNFDFLRGTAFYRSHLFEQMDKGTAHGQEFFVAVYAQYIHFAPGLADGNDL